MCFSYDQWYRCTDPAPAVIRWCDEATQRGQRCAIPQPSGRYPGGNLSYDCPDCEKQNNEAGRWPGSGDDPNEGGEVQGSGSAKKTDKQGQTKSPDAKKGAGASGSGKKNEAGQKRAESVAVNGDGAVNQSNGGLGYGKLATYGAAESHRDTGSAFTKQAIEPSSTEAIGQAETGNQLQQVKQGGGAGKGTASKNSEARVDEKVAEKEA